MDTHKLLYILPDVAYIAELLPGKKEHTFVVHSFRQINGEFIDDNELIAKNIYKLFSKLDSEEYQVVLPDFLFTNTIVEVQETSEAKVKEYIKQTLLPQLDLSSETHVLKPFILNQYGKKSRIQLSAIEKSVVAPIVKGAADVKATLSSVTPLSWTIKSLISLEPSISVIQMGSRGYLALHYIGVDQANDASIDEIDALSETIKTLRGGEPSIQTVYLLTNDLIEENLKDHLNGVIPVQQLTSANNNSEMPSYVQQIIEAGMKSLSIPEYSVPTFALPKLSDVESFLTEAEKAEEADTSETKDSDESENEDDLSMAAVATSHINDLPEIGADTEEDETSAEDAAVELPKPTTPDSDLSLKLDEDTDDEASDSEEEKTKSAEDTETTTGPVTVTSEVTEINLDDDTDDSDVASSPSTESLETTGSGAAAAVSAASALASTAMAKEALEDTKEQEEQEEPEEKTETKPPVVTAQTAEDSRIDKIVTPSQKPVIKNKSAIQPMLKMFFISLSVFFATIAVGVGVGVGFLSLTTFSPAGDSGNQQEEIAEATPTPEPTPVPTPEPAAIDPAEVSVLVVNATTIAGYAGDTQEELTDAGFESVTARNARGSYEPGMYVLIDEDFEEPDALLDFINETLDGSFEAADEKATEDASGQYDVVVVLAE